MTIKSCCFLRCLAILGGFWVVVPWAFAQTSSQPAGQTAPVLDYDPSLTDEGYDSGQSTVGNFNTPPTDLGVSYPRQVINQRQPFVSRSVLVSPASTSSPTASGTPSP